MIDVYRSGSASTCPFTLSGMDAIDRTHVNAGTFLGPNAGFGDDVRHGTSIAMKGTRGTALGRSASYALDARPIPVADRHRRIFELFDKLEEGQAFLLTSDHEPRPLRAEFEQTRKGRFSWRQRCAGAQHWEAVIRKVRDGEADDPSHVLEQSVMFHGSSPEALAVLVETSEVVAFQAHRTIVEQGAVWPWIATVISGLVQAVIVTPDSRELGMFDILSGDGFGAVALVDGGSSPFRYVARTGDTRLLLVPAEAVRTLMENDLAVANAVNALSAQRLRSVVDRFRAHAAQPIPARVAEALLAYASPKPGLSDALPPLPSMRQSELAVIAGTAKDMVYRAIVELEQAGALRREHGRIVQLDRSILLRFSDVTKY